MASKNASRAIDPFEIFKQAAAFEQASFNLSADFKKGGLLMRVPMIVNSSFSMELFLKCLLHLRGKCTAAKGHELLKLYDALDKGDHDRIEPHFIRELKANPVMQNIWNLEKAGKLKPLSWRITDILDRANKAFSGWRFSFELQHNQMIYAGVQPIRDAVRFVIIEDRPTWPVSI